MARASLLAYARLHSPLFQLPPHIRRLGAELEAAMKGVEEAIAARDQGLPFKKQYLQVMMPPQNGKSTLGAEFFISWALGHHPEWNIAYASYAGDFAEKRGGKIRDLCATPLHQAVFPEFGLSDSTSAKAEWDTTKGGGLKSVGRGGGLTGRPVTIAVIDDPFKDQAEADSKTIREACKDWYHGSVETRQPLLTIIINTRWHVDDLSGYTLREHSHLNWRVLSFPAINDDGESLWPERYPIENLQAIKQGMKPRVWAALYQQSPIVEDGNLVDPRWLREYDELPGEKPDRIVQSWDFANKKGETTDYTVCTTWACYGPHAYLVDVLRRRMTFNQAKNAIHAQFNAWQPSVILMEDRANGIGLLDELKATTKLPLVGIDPGSTPKDLRMSQVTDLMEAGQVFIPSPRRAPWVAEYVMEMTVFPEGTHDDQADSTSQFLSWLKDRLRRSCFFIKTTHTAHRQQRVLRGYH